MLHDVIVLRMDIEGAKYRYYIVVLFSFFSLLSTMGALSIIFIFIILCCPQLLQTLGTRYHRP